MTIKQEKLSSYLAHNIFGLRKMAGKAEHFSWKIVLKWTCSQIFRKYSYWESFLLSWIMLTLFRMGFFGATHEWEGGAKRPPLPKIRHTYPAMIKLGTVIPYLRKTQKLYKSRDTLLEFCWHQHFSTGDQQILLYQEMQT